MDRWQYLIVLGACLLITLPLEFFGEGVYRQPRRTIQAVVPIAVVFLIWDAVAIHAHIWNYNAQYVTGLAVGSIPIEEVLFFVVIPLCGLLTFNAVNAMLGRLRRIRRRADEPAGQQ